MKKGWHVESMIGRSEFIVVGGKLNLTFDEAIVLANKHREPGIVNLIYVRNGWTGKRICVRRKPHRRVRYTYP